MKHKRLSLEEREEIKVSLSHGLSYRCIAKKLGRSHSTITREVQRFGKGRDGYSAVKAEKKANHPLNEMCQKGSIDREKISR